MRASSVVRLLNLCVFCLVIHPTWAAGPTAPIELWPGAVPGEMGDIGEEKDTTKPTDGLVAGRRVARLGNVSKPTLTFFRPGREKDTGSTVMVIPGGGYNILALDLEGTEVCEWLNSIGVTAALLKYRVPKRAELERHVPPLQDAQRALGVLRHRAKEFGLDGNRIGVIGFSAGGHLAAALASSTSKRTYASVDAADSASCRPDFSILIHPAYLVLKEQGDKMSPEVQVTTNHPPTFLAMTGDDPVRIENAVLYYLALKQSHVPAELHVYPTGGHGYGLRRTEHYVTTWPDRAADWMRSRGLLGKK
jgi:acetyl esterase/lipase